MRKQKASDKRTRRLQRSGAASLLEEEMLQGSTTPIPAQPQRRGSTASPMETAAWKQRKIRNAFPNDSPAGTRAGEQNRGRGRSRKRSQLYSRLATYNNDFVALLTAEYRAEVCATCIEKIDEKPAGAPKFSPKILTRIFLSNPFIAGGRSSRQDRGIG